MASGVIVFRGCSMVLADDVLRDVDVVVDNGVVKCISCPGDGVVVDCRDRLMVPCPYDAYTAHGGPARGSCGGLEPRDLLVARLEDPSVLGELPDRVVEACGSGRKVVIYASVRRSQVFLFKKRTGMFPVEALLDQGVLSPCTILYNPIWISSWELKQVADSGAAIALSPSGWLGEPGGFFPIREAVDYGILVGVGSGEEGHDIWLEATLLYHIASMVYGQRLEPRIILNPLIQGGAAIVGKQNPLAIKEGARIAGAALVKLDSHVLSLIGRHGVEEALVRLGSGALVDTVPLQ